MNNMNLRRPNDYGCKMNYNFNQNSNDCSCKQNYKMECGNNKPAYGGNTNCKPDCGNNKPSCGCNPDCGNNKPSCGCNSNCDADSSSYNDPLAGMAPTIGYVPWQQWCKIYDLCKGLNQGTIFPSLDLPFFGCIPRGYFKGQGGAL